MDPWSGRRPETSFTTRPRPVAGTSRTEKSPWSIWRPQEHQGGPWNGDRIVVTCDTPGKVASFGSGWLLYTMASKPWLAANRGNAESARRPAVTAASTSPVPTARTRPSSSQDRQ